MITETHAQCDVREVVLKSTAVVRLLPSVVLFAAVCLYPLLWQSAPHEAKDTKGYQEVAQDYLAGRFNRVHFRVPGFPLLLIATHSARELNGSLFLAQLFLYLLTTHLLLRMLTARQVSGALVTAAALILASPPFVEHTSYALTESLTGSLLVLALLVATTTSKRLGTAAMSGISGVLFGLTALTRPTYQLAAFAVGLVFLVQRQWSKAIAVVCGACLVIGAFLVFNYANTGYLGTTPALGFNLSTRTARVVERLPPSRLRDALVKARDDQLVSGASHTGVMYIWAIKPQLPSITGMREQSLDRFMLRLNLRLIMAAPLEYLSDVGRAAVTYWFPALTAVSFGHSRVLELAWTALSFAVVGVFWATLLMVCGTWATHGLRSAIGNRLLPVYAVAVAIVIYTMAVSCLFEVGNPRYRVPTDAIVVAAAALGLMICHRERTETNGSL